MFKLSRLLGIYFLLRVQKAPTILIGVFCCDTAIDSLPNIVLGAVSLNDVTNPISFCHDKSSIGGNSLSVASNMNHVWNPGPHLRLGVIALSTCKRLQEVSIIVIAIVISIVIFIATDNIDLLSKRRRTGCPAGSRHGRNALPLIIEAFKVFLNELGGLLHDEADLEIRRGLQQ